jgi:hypothetical protein
LEQDSFNDILFKLDGAPQDFRNKFWGVFFIGGFPRKQRSRGDLIIWSTRSPDLTPRTERCLYSTTARTTRTLACAFTPAVFTDVWTGFEHRPYVSLATHRALFAVCKQLSEFLCGRGHPYVFEVK